MLEQVVCILFGQSNHESHHSNEFATLVEELGFEQQINPDDNVHILRGIGVSDVLYENSNVYYSGRRNNPLWLPVRNDGIFYTEDAKEKLNNGRVCTNISLMIGSNSFEGSYLYFAETPLDLATPSRIKHICKYLRGYEEDKITIASRMLVVSDELHTPIVNGYFEEYKEYFNKENIEDLSAEGDVWCRKYSIEAAKLYKEAGVDVYMYYLDIEMSIDWLLQRPSPYGCGHGNDVLLMMGAPYIRDYPNYKEYWPNHFCGTTPTSWQYEASDIFVNQWSQFIKTGKPYQNWTMFDSNEYALLLIKNNNTNAVINMESGADPNIRFWVDQYPTIENALL